MVNIKVLTVAVIAIIGLACFTGFAISLANHENTYSITYELGGGTNSESNPTTYVSGYETTLYTATKDDMVFYSWCLDPELTKECKSITPDMSGDIILYAKWTDSLAGKGFTLTLSGNVNDGIFNSYTLDGTATYKYVYYDSSEDRYFMQYNSEIVYKYGYTQQTRTNDDSYWSDENDGNISWVQLEDSTIDTANGSKLCKVYLGTYTNGSTEKQWIGDDWIPYKIVYESSGVWSTTSITYTYSDDFTFKSEENCKVTAYTDIGVTVSGTGTYNPGQTVTLTASTSAETTFKGWYDENGKQLSSSTIYKVAITGTDVVVYAKNTTDPDFTYESDEPIELKADVTLTSAIWKIVSKDSGKTIDTITGITPTYAFADAGEYYLFVDGEIDSKEYHGCYDVVATGDILRSYEWKYSGKTYTYNLEIDYEKLMYYRNLYDVSERCQYSNDRDHDRSFVTYDDEYIQELAAYFESQTSSMTNSQTVNFILMFTQSIEYQLDEVYMGYDEYWKFPVETLYDKGGDCEDTSILYCSIAKAMGYDTAMLLFTGHMASGVYTTGLSGECAVYDGVAYYYCENTASGYYVGDVPSSIRISTAKVVVIY